MIAYGSFALTAEQRKYCTTRKELLAVLRFTRQWRHHLLGRPFIVRKDHASLIWLTNFREPQGQLARWMEELSQYNMVLRHRSGRKHGNADSLSRMCTDEGLCEAFVSGVRPESLPCEGCKYCVRANQNWGSFIDEVDEAVPLAKGGMQGISLSCDDMGNRLGIRSGHGETETVKKEKDDVSSQKSKNETIVQAVHVSPGVSGFTGDAEMMDQLEHSVHAEVIFRDGEVHVLTVGTEGGEDNSELICKASCWGFSLEDLRLKTRTYSSFWSGCKARQCLDKEIYL